MRHFREHVLTAAAALGAAELSYRLFLETCIGYAPVVVNFFVVQFAICIVIVSRRLCLVSDLMQDGRLLALSRR